MTQIKENTPETYKFVLIQSFYYSLKLIEANVLIWSKCHVNGKLWVIENDNE